MSGRQRLNKKTARTSDGQWANLSGDRNRTFAVGNTVYRVQPPDRRDGRKVRVERDSSAGWPRLRRKWHRQIGQYWNNRHLAGKDGARNRKVFDPGMNGDLWKSSALPILAKENPIILVLFLILIAVLRKTQNGDIHNWSSLPLTVE